MLRVDKILKDRRRLFVSSVSPGTLSSLLDELLDQKVLNQEEMERVRCENATTTDKARALIDSIIRKGPQACQILIAFICAEDSFLAEKLKLSGKGQGTEGRCPCAQRLISFSLRLVCRQLPVSWLQGPISVSGLDRKCSASFLLPVL